MKVLLGWNLAVFLLYGYDKLKSLRGAWRIREKTLFLYAAFFGGAGALLGMWLFRHKIRKPFFRYGVPLILVSEGAILYVLLPVLLPKIKETTALLLQIFL